MRYTLRSNDMSAFKQALASSKRIIAVAGAGLSASSGVPTFRGAGGMWRKYESTSIATPEAFEESPSRVWQFYHYRREKILQAQPNAAHIALAKFSLSAFREKIAPGSTFTLITQNVDGLSTRALASVKSDLGGADIEDPAESAILEMHGRLFDIVCTVEECGHVEANFDSPICPALVGTEDLMETSVVDPVIPLEDLPRCAKCGALARPGVVWFGEVPLHLDEIDALTEKADLCLVIGTSSMVYPAAGLANDVRDAGGKVAVFNVERSAHDSVADFLFLGPCEELLPEALCLSD